MGQPLEVHIRKLQEFYWSEADPTGRGFVPLADALRKAGELQEARRILREGLRRHPEFLAGHVVSAWLSLDEGDLDQAEDHYLDALELDPRNIAVLRGLSEVHLSKGNERQAVSYLETLLQEDPVDLDLPERLADLKNRLAAEAGSEEDDRRSLGLTIWDDSNRAADELNWHRATLQDDSSPDPEEAEEEAELHDPVDVDPEFEVPVEGEPDGADELEALFEAEPEAEDELEPVLEGEPDGAEELEALFEDEPEVEDEPEPLLEDEPEAEDEPEPLLEDEPDAEDQPTDLDPPVLIVEDGEPIPDAGELEDSLVTSTLGEIYLRQGLLGRAEWVFDSLLQDDPENEHLRRRLDEVQELLAVHGPHRPSTSSDPAAAEALAEEEEIPVGEILDEPDVSVQGWVPGEVADGVGDETSADIVPIELLAPDRTTPPRTQPMEGEEEEELEILPVGALEPDELPSVESLAPDEILPIEALSPDGAVAIDALAPDEILPIEALAPDEIVSIDALAPDEIISIDALAPDEIISIDALAPEEFISIDALAPDTAGPGPQVDTRTAVSIDSLAPDDPVSIEALAPEEEESPGSDQTVDDFERWLDKLQ